MHKALRKYFLSNIKDNIFFLKRGLIVQNNNPIRVAERIKYTESIVSFFFFLNIRRYLCQLHNMPAILLSPGMGLLTYIKHAYVTCRLLTAIYISHLVFTLFLAQFLCTSRVYISFASFGGRNVCTHFVTLFCYELNLHTRISIFFLLVQKLHICIILA